VRAYLAVADATPKPFPFPAEGLRQFTELRESADRVEVWFRVLLEQKELQVRNPDRDNLRRYQEANERLAPPSPDKPRVVFFGDSITDGWRLNEYFEGRDFVNRGISGQVTGEMLGRMQSDVIALQPKAMIILAGTNDIARGTALPTIQKNLTSIAELAELHKIKPIFTSILPVSDYHKANNPRFEMTKGRPPEKILEMNKWLRAFCQRHSYTYVDYFAAMADAKGFLGADLADDGLHPNAKGYRVMAPLALAAIDNAVKAPAPTPSKRRK
jgi:lysophospholipase L1-like esterase